MKKERKNERKSLYGPKFGMYPPRPARPRRVRRKKLGKQNLSSFFLLLLFVCLFVYHR
jgi:hypothetical protein